MNKKAFPEWLITLLVLCVAFTAALIVRIALPYPSVFTGQWIKLTGIDAYYYMRLVDNLVHNFPQLISFDPYAIFPGGAAVSGVPMFFAYLMATIIRLLGGAAPPQQTIDTIAVFIPPVLGALSVIPVYFIARALINRWAGIIAVLLMAVMPGEFLSRSLLGYTDHHVAEEFFTSYFTMFFILAIKNGRQFTYDMLKNRQFPSISRHIPYSLAAGIFLGLYLITWQGALLFVFIVFLYFVIQFISDYLHGFPTDYLSKIAIITFLISILIFVPVSRDKATLMALAALILVPIALNIISVFMSARNIKPAYFIGVVSGLVIAGTLITIVALPFIAGPLRGFLVPLFSWNMQQIVVGEMKPLFFPGGFFTFEVAWSQFAAAFFTGLIGLALMIYQAIRKGDPANIFVVTWSLIMMLATFAMIRYASYFAVCIAILTGYLGGWIIEALSKQKEQIVQDKTRKKTHRLERKGKTTIPREALIATIVVVFAIVVLLPCSTTAINEAKSPGHAPSNVWMEALGWLKKNTPEPFGNADYYYELYQPPEPGKAYTYPQSAYGVLVWGDYGYWVLRIGRRIPTATTGSIALSGEAVYFSSDNPADAQKIMREKGAKYVIIDSRIASPNDKFYAILTIQYDPILSNNATLKKESDYYELCW
ncbi:MAG: oligosaccharyl transferase, archaeosortase A system-associated [Dehalococcoidia bacterium]|nr:oligosaccharyl transferase, archaeosortase A system-associated [Dehalococcoidia bacterium]